MKLFTVALSYAIYVSSLSGAEEFPEKERKAIAKEVSGMMASFNQGDAKALIEKTHPSIYKLAKGKENFEAALLAAAKQIMDQGIVIESFTVERPEKLYKAGDDSVCFVPKTLVMVLDGRRIKSVSYMVAIKGKDEVWRYLDGAGARKNPDQLWSLLPDLPKDVDLPENTVTRIENEEADQPATAPESKPEEKEKSETEPEGR